MGNLKNDQILITPLSQIHAEGGDVYHALKQFDFGYNGFGEVYFSWIDEGYFKGWKRHLKMTMNLVVPVGNVNFIFYSNQGDLLQHELIGENNYVRLTVPPGTWFGFRGQYSPKSLVLNVANIPHDPNEVERLPINAFNYNFI